MSELLPGDPDIDGPDPLSKALDEAGLTQKYWIKKLKAELNAKKTQFFQKDGVVIESRNVIDWSTRQKARQDLAIYRGDKPAEQHDIRTMSEVQVILKTNVKPE